MKTYFPTTPSRRALTGADYSGLTGIKPYKPLVKRLKTHAGRNADGRITVRHQTRGNKKIYTFVYFKQNKLNRSAGVEPLEYDPYRPAFIARLSYIDGERRYMLAPDWCQTVILPSA